MENIEVAIRIRPISQTEANNNDIEIWSAQESEIVAIPTEKYSDLIRLRKIAPGQKTSYLFNKCFDQTSSNAVVYEQIVKRIALSSLEGINGTVFMYGQTGSGKTFTMMGSAREDNLIAPQSLRKDNYSRFKNVGGSSQHSKSPGRGRELTTTSNPFKNIPQAFKNGNNFSNSPHHSTKGIQHSANRSSAATPDNQFQGVGVYSSSSSTSQLVEKSPIIELNKINGHNHNVQGILGLSVEDIFKEMEKLNNMQFLLRCSYVEIYTDFVYDLLQTQDKLGETLQICEDHNKEFFVKGAIEQIVDSREEIMLLLNQGEQNRHYASTAMNHVSSRSHTIFRLCVRSMPKDFHKGNNEGITESVLNFVDLAGSEKTGLHQHVGSGKDRQIESRRINKSLFFLTQVISMKSNGKQEQHIPYRNSPLTKILRSSLGGNSRTCIILCLNPCISQLEQSLGTLRFGQCAKKIENNIKQNVIQVKDQNGLVSLVKEYESRILELEQETKLNKVTSDNLVKMIQSLIQQKNILQEQIQEQQSPQLLNNNFHQNQINHSSFLNYFNQVQFMSNYLDHIQNVGIIMHSIKTNHNHSKNQLFKEKIVNNHHKFDSHSPSQIDLLRQELQSTKQENSRNIEKLNKKIDHKKKKLVRFSN